MNTPKLTENAWQRQIVDTAHRFGWIAAHFPTSNPEGRYRTTVAYDAKGFPDLVLVRERLVVIECKAQKGALRAEQARWLDSLLRAGVEAYIARPSDVEAVEWVLRHRGGGAWDTDFSKQTAGEVARTLGKAAA